MQLFSAVFITAETHKNIIDSIFRIEPDLKYNCRLQVPEEAVCYPYLLDTFLK